MPEHHFRTPIGERSAGHALNPQAFPETTLFDLTSSHQVHPDFEARTAIWAEHRAGLISLAEAQRRSAIVGGLTPIRKGAPRQAAACRPRHSRPAPNDSRQYAGGMATTAARDDRLTPNAKALLQVLRARCGKGCVTEFAKATMAAVMSRSPRTIRRYLFDLERLGYIATEIRRTGRGLHTGLVVSLTEKVAPFFEQAKGLAAWLAETPKALERAFTGRVLANEGVTLLTPKNQTRNSQSLRGPNLPWSRTGEPPRRAGWAALRPQPG